MKNQLKDMQLKHKKKQKGMSPFITFNAGDVEYGINTFNNSTMSEEYNSQDRYNIINELKNKFHRYYKFDKYTTEQLYNILLRLKSKKHQEDVEDELNKSLKIKPNHTLIDDPKFNYDDPDREGEYEVEKMNIRESLNKLDHIGLDTDNYQDLLNLYEAVQPKLTAQDKQELKKIISSTNDPTVVANALQAKAAQQESFEEDMNKSTCNYVDRYNNIVIYECNGKYIATAINGKSVSGKSVDDVKAQLDKIDAEYRKHFNDLEEDANVDYTYTLEDIAEILNVTAPEHLGAPMPSAKKYCINEINIPHNMRFKDINTDVYDNVIELHWVTEDDFDRNDFNIFLKEVQSAFNEIIEDTNYTEPFEVEVTAVSRSYDEDDYYQDGESYGFKVLRFNDSTNESLNERYDSYDMRDGWTPEDIQKHKSIDWKERNYEEYEDTSDQFKSEVVFYSFDRNPERKTVLMSKYFRPNPIYPPYYKAASGNKPFEYGVGPMFDGHMHGNYDIHDRYESQEVYDMLSEDLNENTNTLDLEARKVYDILKEYGANSIKNTQGVYEIGFSDEINDSTLILNQLESNGYEYITDYGSNDVYIVDYIDESKKFNIKVVDGDKITVYVSIEESINEDYQSKDDNWGKPFLERDIERILSKLTGNFREKDGTVSTGYEEEKQIAKKVLSKYYNIVEVSDGRRDKNDDIVYVISYASPKF